MGGRYRIRAGSRLFHQFVRLPELSDTEFFPREILAGRRLPVRQQIKLRPSRTEHSDLLPVGTKYVAYLKLQIVSGLAGMGLQTGERFGPRET